MGDVLRRKGFRCAPGLLSPLPLVGPQLSGADAPQDYFTDYLFEDCARQFSHDRLPGGGSEYPHIGGAEADGQPGISEYTHAIIVTCNTSIQEALSADFFLSLNPDTKIKILGLSHQVLDDKNEAAYKRIVHCIKTKSDKFKAKLEAEATVEAAADAEAASGAAPEAGSRPVRGYTIQDSQIEFYSAVDPNAEQLGVLQQWMQELCVACWRDQNNPKIVVNMTSGERRQTRTIVNTASAYGCELVYMDMEPGSWVGAIGAPDPRRQFLRVIPNPMGETFGIIRLQRARDLFSSKSFLLAR